MVGGKKMKTYYIMFSRVFPDTYYKTGDTNFKQLILEGIKTSTIRENLDFWKPRINKVQQGQAILSLREWTGKPLRSAQREFTQITQDDHLAIDPVRIHHAPGKASVWVGDDEIGNIFHHGLNDIYDYSTRLKEFSTREGFPTVGDFFQWFNVEFNGGFIHWESHSNLNKSAL